MLGFFKRGWTTACLKVNGKMLVPKELLVINKILGPTVSVTSLRSLVGKISRLHVVDFIRDMTSDKKNSDTGSKLPK